MNEIDQRGHRIIRRSRIFYGLTGCQSDPQVGVSQLVLELRLMITWELRWRYPPAFSNIGLS